MKRSHKILQKLLGLKAPQEGEVDVVPLSTLEEFMEKSEQAYPYLESVGKEATHMRNNALSLRRQLYFSVFSTSGAFLTVAVPLLSQSDVVSESMAFKWIIVLLFSSLILGIIGAILEINAERDRFDLIYRNIHGAAIYYQQGEFKKSAKLVAEATDDLRQHGSTKKLLWLLIVQRLGELAVFLFTLGMISFVLWFLYNFS